MAPEVHRNQPYNEAADVFSFGVVAYEVLSRTMLIFTHVGDGGAFVAQDSGEDAELNGRCGQAGRVSWGAGSVRSCRAGAQLHGASSLWRDGG